MIFMRALVLIEFVFCITLYLSKKLEWHQLNDLLIMDWVFLFAYPMSFIVLILMVFLVAADIGLLNRKDKKVNKLWLVIDIVIPISSYFLFQSYYSLIL